MPPVLALCLWFVFVMALLRYDPSNEPRPSAALWVPLIWLFIVASRLPSQWLGGDIGQAASDLQEGNELDRIVYLLLIVAAFAILMSRAFDWGAFFSANMALTLLLLYSLVSVLWSDFPLIAFKRWFRDMGLYLALLVALSDATHPNASRLLLRRLLVLLIPLSIVLNKYFPDIAREFDPWTGRGYYAGAATSKNLLGVLCLLGGLYFFWDTAERWHARREPKTAWIIRINILFFGLVLLLLADADSATSSVCLVLGCIVIALAHTGAVKKSPALLTATVPLALGTYLLLQFGFGVDIIATLAQLVGRNPDLTGRTYIWDVVLSTQTDPWIGTGYESFWLGPRLEWVWNLAGTINQAHNGYLEIYLTLGMIGVVLLAAFLIAGYRSVCRSFRSASPLASFALAVWTVLLFYNATESAFRGHLLWMALLIGVLNVPGSRDRPAAVDSPQDASPDRF